MLGRPTHLRHTELLLDDPIPDVVRMAIRTLCRAGWGPALPAVTGLLGHPHPVVHETAADGLVELGGKRSPPSAGPPPTHGPTGAPCTRTYWTGSGPVRTRPCPRSPALGEGWALRRARPYTYRLISRRASDR